MNLHYKSSRQTTNTNNFLYLYKTDKSVNKSNKKKVFAHIEAGSHSNCLTRWFPIPIQFRIKEQKSIESVVKANMIKKETNKKSHRNEHDEKTLCQFECRAGMRRHSSSKRNIFFLFNSKCKDYVWLMHCHLRDRILLLFFSNLA